MSFASAPVLADHRRFGDLAPGAVRRRHRDEHARVRREPLAEAGDRLRRPGFESSIRATLAVSIADPPPSATMKSGAAFASAAAHASTDAVSGSPAGVA